MFAWLIGNISTIIIGAVLLAIVAVIILNMARDKKKGKSSCGCNCKGCAISGSCHGGCQNKMK